MTKEKEDDVDLLIYFAFYCLTVNLVFGINRSEIKKKLKH